MEDAACDSVRLECECVATPQELCRAVTRPLHLRNALIDGRITYALRRRENACGILKQHDQFTTAHLIVLHRQTLRDFKDDAATFAMQRRRANDAAIAARDLRDALKLKPRSRLPARLRHAAWRSRTTL